MSEEICSNCWYEDQVIRYNINGRCDRCEGLTFIDPGEIEKEEDD